MDEFQELLFIGLDERGRSLGNEMDGTLKFKADTPKPKPWETPKFIADNKAIGAKAASAIRWTAFSTDASRSKSTDAACTTAAFTFGDSSPMVVLILTFNICLFGDSSR